MEKIILPLGEGDPKRWTELENLLPEIMSYKVEGNFFFLNFKDNIDMVFWLEDTKSAIEMLEAREVNVR